MELMGLFLEEERIKRELSNITLFNYESEASLKSDLKRVKSEIKKVMRLKSGEIRRFLKN